MPMTDGEGELTDIVRKDSVILDVDGLAIRGQLS